MELFKENRLKLQDVSQYMRVQLHGIHGNVAALLLSSSRQRDSFRSEEQRLTCRETA